MKEKTCFKDGWSQCFCCTYLKTNEELSLFSQVAYYGLMEFIREKEYLKYRNIASKEDTDMLVIANRILNIIERLRRGD